MDTEWISFRILSRECKNILPLQTHHTSVFILELPMQLRQQTTCQYDNSFLLCMLTRSYHPNNLFVPRARTSASFVPNSCSLWNSLPSSFKVCQSLGSFKYSLRNFSLHL